jgi:hypothetical protein
MVQTYLPDAKKLGDKTLFCWMGSRSWAVNRVPTGDDFRGKYYGRWWTGNQVDVTPRDRETGGIRLSAHGLILLGIDIIGGNSSEVNVTHPTGLLLLWVDGLLLIDPGEPRDDMAWQGTFSTPRGCLEKSLKSGIIKYPIPSSLVTGIILRQH